MCGAAVLVMMMMMRIVEATGKKERPRGLLGCCFFRVCVVLVSLEESKEWFLGCGERRKGS